MKCTIVVIVNTKCPYEPSKVYQNTYNLVTINNEVI